MVNNLSKRRAKLHLVPNTRNDRNERFEKINRSLGKFEHERTPPPLRALTERQAEYIKALRESDQVISMGCAGTGKTFIAATHAADQLRTGKINKIYITRPNISGSKSLGFFPGSMEEKIAPWVVPITEVIKERMGFGAFDVALANGDIEIVPFEVIRGRSFKNCIIILDEAQNVLVSEAKMFLSRIGENCQVIINGDISQSDLSSNSGLSKITHMIKKYMLPIPIIEFTVEDIVRSDICAMWIKAFNNEKI